MIKPQGMSCKALAGKPFETHQTNLHDWLHDSIQNILATSILNDTKAQ
jgi:hypothetical protein